MKNLPIALQVYSVRTDAASDFRGTMEKIKAMGYDGVELAGMYDLSPVQIRDILADIGLTAISAHVPYEVIISDMEKAIEDYKIIGCKYLAVPHLQENQRIGTPAFPQILENIRKFGELCRKNDIILLYHNHDFEFKRMDDGRYGLDYIYDTIPADILQTELDCCWVKVSGEDPANYIRKYAGRCPVVHLKDFNLIGEKPKELYVFVGNDGKSKPIERSAFTFKPIGHGMQDITSIIEAAEQSGAQWLVVEQDVSPDEPALIACEKSIKYLRSL